MIHPYAIAGAFIAILLAVGGSYFYGRHDGRQIEIASQAKADGVARVAREAAIRGAAEEIAKIQVRHTTIKQPVEKEVREREIYRTCTVSDDALRLLNAALEDRDPEPADRLVLPGTD